jgi:hypothetical protein
MPVDFSKPTFFEATLLGLIGIAFYRRLELSLPRILLLVGLIWMALTHVRNIENFAFLAPLVLAKPVAEQWGCAEATAFRDETPRSLPYATILAAIAIATAAWASTTIYVAQHAFVFSSNITPVAAVDLLEKRNAQRIFNTAPFGGYMISRDIKVFIDGRAELYGEKFVMDYFDATEARNLGDFLRLLDTYRIDATLLNVASPAAHALDQVSGWKRLYEDDVAVVHVRTDHAEVSAAPVAAAAD